MPFVTEEVWQHLYADVPEDERPASALIVAPWPERRMRPRGRLTTAPRRIIALLQEIVTRIRDARKQAEVDPAKRVAVILAGGAKTALLQAAGGADRATRAHGGAAIERKLARKPEQAMALVAGGVEVYLPLAGLLDLAKEPARLEARS